MIDTNLEKGKEADAGGHVKHAEIGAYLKNKIVEYGKEHHGIDITLKYIDPTYTIRSVEANASDTIMCTKLAHNAVHAAMAGYTGFSIGHVRNVDAIIPIKCINGSARRRVDLNGRTWQRVLASTGQPQMVCPESMKKIHERIKEIYHEKEEKLKILIDDQVEMSTVILEAFKEERRDEDDESLENDE